MNNLYKNRTLIIFLIVGCVFQTQAQNIGYNNIVPASPGAGAVTQAASGMSSGAVNVSIPLATLNTQNFSVPVSLGYHSTGFKVEELSTEVGHGWALLAGGAITRTIRGKKDPMYPTDQYPGDLFDLNNADTYTYINSATSDNDFDTEPDLFSFNFPGYSGSFVSNGKGEYVTIPYQDLDIKMEVSSIDQTIGYFEITTPDGTLYRFAANEKSKVWNDCQNQEEIDSAPHQKTAWYLTTIVPQKGTDILFQYTEKTSSYASSRSQKIGRKIGTFGDCPNINETCVNYIEHKQQVLSSISSPRFGEIEFLSTSTEPIRITDIIIKNQGRHEVKRYVLDFHTGIHGRTFLKSVSEKSRFGETGGVHQFLYNDLNDLPPRLSYAQDHWGYYNGKGGTDLVPKNIPLVDGVAKTHLFGTIGGDRTPDGAYAQKGLLSRVVYPTGANTIYNYEPNSIYQSIQEHSGSTQLVQTSIAHQANSAAQYESVSISTLDQRSISIAGHLSYLPGGTPDSSDKGILSIYNETLSSYVDGYTNYLFTGNSLNVSVVFDPGYEYSVRVKAFSANNELEANVTVEYDKAIYDTVTKNVETGGVRIAGITSYDPITQKSTFSKYYYGSKNNLNQSSGHRNIKYDYMSYYTEYEFRTEDQQDPCNTYTSCKYAFIQSNSLNAVQQTSGDRMTYEYVTVSQGGSNFENGGIQYQYMLQDYQSGYSLLGDYLKDTPLTNVGWANGLLVNQEIFKKEGNSLIVLKKVTNTYTKDDRIIGAVPGYIIRKKYETACQPAVLTCTTENIKEVYNYLCKVKHNHDYDLTGRCIAPGNDNEAHRLFDSPCFGLNEGDEVFVQDALINLDVTQYKNMSHWYYLSSSTTEVFDENGNDPISTTTNSYFEQAPTHPYVTKVTTWDSRNDEHEVRYRYPQDYNYIPGDQSLIDEMVDKGMSGIPIEIISAFNGAITSASARLFETYTSQKSSLALKSQYVTENTEVAFQASLDAVNFPAPYSQEAQILARDYNGNVISQQASDNVITSYIYGNDGTWLVAKVVNATIAELSVISGIDDELNIGGQGLSQTQLDALNSLPQAFVTSYTYRDGFGISTVTDPNGRVVSYTYDDFGRIKYVKDHDGNVINAKEYHIISQ